MRLNAIGKILMAFFYSERGAWHGHVSELVIEFDFSYNIEQLFRQPNHAHRTNAGLVIEFYCHTERQAKAIDAIFVVRQKESMATGVNPSTSIRSLQSNHRVQFAPQIHTHQMNERWRNPMESSKGTS